MLIEGINVSYLGHSAVKLKNGITIYIDPYAVYDEEKADLILISHSHAENCSLEDIEKLSKEDTVIVASNSCKNQLEQLRNCRDRKIKYLTPGEQFKILGIVIVATAAYNTDLEKRFHLRGLGNGYVIEAGKKRIYFAGHTELVGETRELLAKVGWIDLAFIPVNKMDTMDAEEAAHFCDIIKPRVVVPIHHEVHSNEVHDFRHLVNTAKVVVL
jgi:L-ascorbate metabolism protein UlaG (beta-lactamase superfamily)